MVIKLRDELHDGGAHVSTHVYVGPDADHLASVGTLTFSTERVYHVTSGGLADAGEAGLVGEWTIFGAMVGLGAAHSFGDVTFISEGDDEVARQLEAIAQGMAKKQKEGTTH